MGKLHKLRRAIERHPSDWWGSLRWFSTKRSVCVRGARQYRDGRWAPDYYFSWRAPYRAFVKSVLYDIYLLKYVERVGNADNAPTTFEGLISFLEGWD